MSLEAGRGRGGVRNSLFSTAARSKIRHLGKPVSTIFTTLEWTSAKILIKYHAIYAKLISKLAPGCERTEQNKLSVAALKLISFPESVKAELEYWPKCSSVFAPSFLLWLIFSCQITAAQQGFRKLFFHFIVDEGWWMERFLTPIQTFKSLF